MKKILLVEDNEEIRENTAEILGLADYEVHTAADGKEGYQKALEVSPDIIICDIMMPVLDGYGLLHLVQKNDQLKNTPFIFLTAKTERSDFRKGMELGADDYLTKPFTELELMNSIEIRLRKNADREQAAPRDEGFAEADENPLSIEKLLDDVNYNDFKKKQRIYAEGSNPHYLYYLKEGKVRTYKLSDSGKELTVGLYNAGEFFGYFALIENTVYKESAETIEQCEIGSIKKEDFETLVSSNKTTALTFIRLLAEKVTEKEEQLVNLAYNSLRKRVANALLFLYRKYKAEENNHYLIQVSREDLAHIAGTTTESLIRTISDFKTEKLISVEGSNIRVLQEKKLSDMVN
ncbi:MAG: response regulator [Chitinophagaceae bacterium]|nr:response regulator [Chitinophagaceae bacterium]